MTTALRMLTMGALAAAAIGAGAQTAAAAEVKLIASSSHPPIVPWVATIKNMVVPETNKRLEAMGSPHRVKWTEAYAGALYNFNNTLEGIEQGLGDIGWVGTLWEPVKMPLHNITFYAPFATGNATHLMEIQEDMEANIPAMKAEWDRHNMVFLGAQVADTYHVMSKKPIRKFEDLSGQKLTAAGAIAPWVQNTGAVAVGGGLPVFYNMIKTGVVDGSIIITTGMLPFKLHEVAPYITKADLGGPISGALAINKDTWNALPRDIQTVLKQLGPEYARTQTKLVEANVAKFTKLMKAQGATFIDFPDSERKKWADALPDLAGNWAKANGAAGKQVLKAFMDGVRKRGDKPLRDWDK